MDQELVERILKTLELILFFAILNAWALKDYLVSPLVQLFLWFYGCLRRTKVEDVLGVRACLYLVTLFLQWGLTVCVLSVWAVSGRSWNALGLGTGALLRCGIGFALAALYIAWWWTLHRRALLAQPEWLEPVRRRLAADESLPRTPGERRGFMLVAITVGICEEVLFRGYVMWYVELWTGAVAAVAISSFLFGFVHLDGGIHDAFRATILGLLFALVMLAAGSLWPSILMHAATDLITADFAYRVCPVAEAERPDKDLAV
jgi:membrane protease YdiL (CAAX protease family)